MTDTHHGRADRSLTGVVRGSTTQRISMACARHPWRTVGSWSVVLVLALAANAFLLMSALSIEGDPLTEPDSVKGLNLLEDAFPDRPDISEMVVVRSEGGSVQDPGFQATVLALRDDVASAEAVLDVGNPFGPQAEGMVSQDGAAVLLPVVLDESDSADAAEGIAEIKDAVAGADEAEEVAADITGRWTIGHDFVVLSQSDLEKGEMFGLPAAIVVLLIVFGAFVAAMVPLALALVSIVVSLGISAVVAQAVDVSFFLLNMVVAMGLALGIDYSLFITSRYREERHRGLDKLDAIAVTAGTASKAVQFSGLAFVVALLGLLLIPDVVLRSLGFGAIVVGLVTVAAALTLLPALLSLLGDRIDRGRVPFVAPQHGGESRFWRRAVTLVTRRPGVTVVVTSAALLALAAPVLNLQTGSMAMDTMPVDTAGRQGLVALEASFPQGERTDPLQVVVDGDMTTSEMRSAIQDLRSSVTTDGAFGNSTVDTAPTGDVGLVELALVGDPSGSEAIAALERLRDDYVPDAFAGVEADAYVTGVTAFNVDYAALIDTWFPIVLTVVLSLSFLLLLVVFRSIVLPIKAVLLNLLSVGAAYGLMVLVFQEGIGADLLGLQQSDRVEPWVPVFLFSVLFALSMDYHVFLLTRIRERYLATGDTIEAVAHGVGATGRIITGAALIIVVVFASFATADLVAFQQMGFGIAVALLLDATVVRTVLVPSSMALLGQWNWYLPTWLSWLPDLHVEGGAEGEAEATVTASADKPLVDMAGRP
jgi:putative drug exporter of the RND superfamily